MRLYYGTYGHHITGKLYVYWGDDNLRTGQQVVAPVTHYNSGKNYNTMFTIARAQSEKNAQGEVNRLGEGGIFIKTISGRDVLSLPGGANFESKAAWKRDSDRRYRQKYGLPEPEEPKKPASSKKPASPKSPSPGKKRKKKGKKTAKKIGKAAVRLLAKTTKEVKVPGNARMNVLKNKSAADSFNARGRLIKTKQREAFIED